MRFRSGPRTVAYCHCSDCRRWTGAALPAFAAFDAQAVQATPGLGPSRSHVSGVERWNCPACGSPLAAQFAYLPGQTYIPLGLIDQIDTAAPELHCHADNAPPWLCIKDTLPRHSASGRDTLNKAKT